MGIVTWGATEGPVREAVTRLLKKGLAVAAFVPKVLNPLPSQELKAFMDAVDVIVVPEVNFTGQFANVLRARFQVEVEQINKYAGVPFFAHELEERIEGLYRTHNLPVVEEALEGDM